MKVLVLGGDGFCGWPTSLHLSAQGYEVAIVDNLSRRKIDIELECESLTPIRPMGERLAVWEELTGNRIDFHNINVAENYRQLLDLLLEWQPDAVIHFAEQRAAPYSMKSSYHKRYTVDNNLNATNNLLAAITESGLDTHVVHLGTMGVYGYGTAGMQIPEGYLTVKVETEGGEIVEQEILYPPNPGSIYHMTKTQDQLLFAYYNKNDLTRVTDLHQGIVWGTQTAETRLDERLINRFDYDGDYGTVLNRFLMQAAVGYPLTVHGTGGQTRAFIHIQDTVRCIQLALENPPERGDRVNVYNQMTETHRLRDLARLVSERTGAEIDYVQNPRNEADENDLHVRNDRFLDLGLQPTTLSEGLLEEVTEIAVSTPTAATPRRFPPPRCGGRGGGVYTRLQRRASTLVSLAAGQQASRACRRRHSAALRGVRHLQVPRRGSRLDLLLSLLIALGVVLVSVVPQIFGIFTRLLGLEDRGFALLSIAVLLLFGLFLNLLARVREAAGRRNGEIVTGLAVKEYSEKYLSSEERAEGHPGEVLIIVPAYDEEGGIQDVCAASRTGYWVTRSRRSSSTTARPTGRPTSPGPRACPW